MLHVEVALQAGVRATLTGDVVRDFGVRHHDLAIHFFLAQTRERQFGARVVRERGPGHTLRLDPRAVHFERHIVRLREAFERFLHGGVVDVDAVFLRLLQLDALQHHLVEHLLAQLVQRRDRRVLLVQPARDQAHAVVQFAPRDDTVVDHRGNGIDRLAATAAGQRLRLDRRNRQERRRGGETGRKRCQAKLFHDCHRYSNDVGRAWPVFSHSIKRSRPTRVIRNW